MAERAWDDGDRHDHVRSDRVPAGRPAGHDREYRARFGRRLLWLGQRLGLGREPARSVEAAHAVREPHDDDDVDDVGHRPNEPGPDDDHDHVDDYYGPADHYGAPDDDDVHDYGSAYDG